MFLYSHSISSLDKHTALSNTNSAMYHRQLILFTAPLWLHIFSGIVQFLCKPPYNFGDYFVNIQYLAYFQECDHTEVHPMARALEVRY